ncbi:unnamed protein product [Allacma fusca]|uniref:Uncharacterized protein n=1 Tax=Allacma fusca TaxID=39272 RepID=A0A8J2LH12_9HEXA|nr:unnamed protein product [Allacma fusca]
MQFLAMALVLTTVMISDSLSSPVLGSREDQDPAGFPLTLDASSLSDPELLQESDNRNDKDVLVSPILLWKLLQLSRLHQENGNPKRSHYKQCAFNAVSCFG